MKVTFRTLTILVISMLYGCSYRPPTQFQVSWERYVEQYYVDGRIVDTGNKGISHTEGQGYAMLFAEAADDKRRFDDLWSWTKSTLQRADNLFSWRYSHCSTADYRCISDKNNASDGEILIAWALLRASERWSYDNYEKEAEAIIEAISNKLIIDYENSVLLLPGEFGFSEPNQIQINLSYWVFPALEAFYHHTGEDVWRKLIDNGLSLISSASFGEFNLNPDWVMISNHQLTLNGAISTEYGYNACRVPLHVVWSYPKSEQLSGYIRFWSQNNIPATIDLLTNEPAPYQLTTGMESIKNTVLALVNNESTVEFTPINADMDYFSASLVMLSQLAWMDAKE